MLGMGSFLRNLSGLPAPPTPPKMPSTISRRVSDDELSNHSPCTPSSEGHPTLRLSSQSSNVTSYSSLYPSIDPQDKDKSKRAIRRRSRRTNGASGFMPGAPLNGGAQPTSRQSIYALDASHAKRMEEIGWQRRLQSLRQAQSVADMKEDDDAAPLVPKKSKPNVAPAPLTNPLPTPPLDDGDIPSAPDHIKDIQGLQNLLSETTAELRALTDHAQKLKAKHNAEKRTLCARIQDLERQSVAQKNESSTQKDVIHDLTGQLNDFQKQLAILQEENEALRDAKAAQKRTIKDLKAAAQQTKTEMSILTKEKQTWQRKLDGIHNRLHRAERQLRCLDHVTRAKLDSRQSGLTTDIKRNPLFASKGLGTEISNQITVLNAWIQPTALLLTRDLVRSTRHRSPAQVSSRSVEVFGEGMSALLQVHANQRPSKIVRDFLQTVMEIFMVHWATMIIEAWYPQQQSFADILAELSAQKRNPRTAPIQCGAPVKLLGTTSLTTDFQKWAVEMLTDLDVILLDADVVFPVPARNDVRQNLIKFSEKAYDLRASLAERDLCGNIQLDLVPPDTLFQAKWMEGIHANATANGMGAVALVDAEPVAGTCRLGLRMPGPIPGTPAVLALKPKVALLSKLKETL